jgi:hypothetical protein
MSLTTVAVSVYSSLATGQALANGRVRLMLTSADVDGSVIAPTPIDEVLDNNGFVVVNLWPNARGTQNSQYNASFYDSNGRHVLDVVATIPASNCNLHDHLATLVTDPGMTSLAASSGSSLVGFTQSGTGAVARTVQDKAREVVSVKDFGAKGDGVTDDTAAIQRAFTYAQAVGRAVSVPAGSYLVTSQLTYSLTGSDSNLLPGINLKGEGMGKSVFFNAVSNAAMIFVSSTAPNFAYGNLFADFSIVKIGSPVNQIGIRSKGCWFTNFDRVRIYGLSGIGVQAGDAAAVNPDTTANSVITFNSCWLDNNVTAFYNPINNNAPMLRFVNTSIRNNTQTGVIANSSHIVFDECSIAFNGLTDYANALGGVVINQTNGSADGYRSKDVRIQSCEVDTNYPFGIDIQTAEEPVIQNCSMKWEDYPGTAAASLPNWPAAQIRLGGTDNFHRVIGAVIRENHVGILNNGLIASGPNGHALLYIRPYAQSVKWRRQMYDIVPGSAVAGVGWFLIKEDSKVGTSPDLSAPRYHVDYDFPNDNGSTAWVSTTNAYNVPYKKVFPAQLQNTQFQFSLATDSVKTLSVPTKTSESTAGADYGFVAVTAAGNTTRSDIFAYRASTGPSCNKLGSASTAMTASTGVLAGTTGTAGQVTVAVDASANLYIENRSGSTLIFNVGFLVFPGVSGQV